eukprot:TRINITY_DN10817_c0_g1_i1.p1 TRINITY_DN10817_c0_g1~~TRINITY_DN10817_c0_g1_i1.p1  ORF type:complete len:247 (-),score=64.29 TRINITY_DN10817_c0_g1_i1:33-773(-)
MARRYDTRTTIFSPQGRLYQVEYAIKAIQNAGTAVGILTKEGIVLAAAKMVTSKLLEQKGTSEKMYIIDDHLCSAVAGITADANILVDYARRNALQYKFRYGEPIPVESLIQNICDLKQSYTQFGGLRPYGVSFLLAGFDKHYGFQLYKSDPSGNFGGWKATSIGPGEQQADSLLKNEYDEDISLENGLQLALKVLSKSMDTTQIEADKLEFSTISLNDREQLEYHLLTENEIADLVASADLEPES